MTAPGKKIYTQAELDQAIKEAGFATEDHRRLLEDAYTALAQMDRINGRTRLSTLWQKAYAAFLNAE